MGSIKDKVAVVGMGCTAFKEAWTKDPFDLMVDATYEAYADAGVGPEDIEAVFVGNQLTFQTSAAAASALKLHNIPVTRVENACATGTEAVRMAAYSIAAGIYDVVLALGIEKLKDTGFSGLPQDYNQPGQINKTWRQQSAVTVANFAMMATSYFAAYGLNPDEGKRILAQIAVKNHKHGSLTPKAMFHNEITLGQALSAPIIAWPLGLYDCCGVSDGAAAAILCRADLAKSFRPDPIYLKSLQICASGYQGLLDPEYDFTQIKATIWAGQKAYAEAGIKNPRQEISVANVHDCFTITELTIYEDLGLSPKGKAKEDVESGVFTITGDLPINTDGGLKCFGHPIGASGIRMIYEIYQQLRQKAGRRQIKNPTLGLTHNYGGHPPWGVAAVTIFGNS
ncbi:MAG: acetyl-CoA acetyltransferase [Desulfobaccales bacterium]